MDERILHEDIWEELSMTIMYLCDGRYCEGDCGDCKHTTDIEHAKNFHRIGETYIEEEEE